MTRLVSLAEASSDNILRELVELAQDPSTGLVQLRALAAARQYSGLHALFRRYVRDGADVLDWGAGNGHFSYFLVRSGYRATGYSFQSFGFASWLPEAGYRFMAGSVADPVRLPFPDASFDAVASVGVLEHVRETGGTEVASLAEIVRVLRPGGVFIVWHLPNRWSWIEALADVVPGKHHHRYRYRPEELDRLLAQSGLVILDRGTYGVLPRNSLGRLPRPIRGSKALADVWDLLDRLLTIPLRPVAQNHWAVARKPVH